MNFIEPSQVSNYFEKISFQDQEVDGEKFPMLSFDSRFSQRLSR